MITFCERTEENGVGAWKKLRRRTAGRCQMASARNRISGFGFKLWNWKSERRFVGARIIQTQNRHSVARQTTSEIQAFICTVLQQPPQFQTLLAQGNCGRSGVINLRVVQLVASSPGQRPIEPGSRRRHFAATTNMHRTRPRGGGRSIERTWYREDASISNCTRSAA